MKIIKIILLERLHRYAFDNIYLQDYQNNFIDRIILNIYKKSTRIHNNWRFDFRVYCKTAMRYSDYDRINDSEKARYILIKQYNHDIQIQKHQFKRPDET